MSRGTRHPAWVMTEARRMADGGWNAEEIRQHLARRGITPVPHWTTVRIWTDREYAARHARQRTRHNRVRSAAKGGHLGRVDHTPQFKVRRVRALAALDGMTPELIATVMRFDYRDAITPEQVTYVLRLGKYPIADDEFTRMVIGGVSYEEIAAHFGVKLGTVVRKVTQMRSDGAELPRRADRPGMIA